VPTDQSKATDVITLFLERSEKTFEPWTNDTSLWGEGLGLDSLEAAELSAMLEDELGTDPFSSGGDIPERVGDILAFYASAPE
jgi:acyl carrier protein